MTWGRGERRERKEVVSPALVSPAAVAFTADLLDYVLLFPDFRLLFDAEREREKERKRREQKQNQYQSPI